MPSNRNKVIVKTAQFRGKSKLETVLKIKRYEQRLTQGYSPYGRSECWAPEFVYDAEREFVRFSLNLEMLG